LLNISRYLLIFTILFLSGNLWAFNADPPFEQGEIFADRWLVLESNRMVNVLILQFENSETKIKADVEISYNNSKKITDNSSRYYLVKPGIKYAPPLELVQNLVYTLTQWEKQPEHVAFVNPARNELRKSEKKFVALCKKILLIFLVSLLYFMIRRKKLSTWHNIRQTGKQVLLWIITLLPLIFLLSILFPVLQRVIRIAEVDSAEVLTAATNYFAKVKGQDFSFEDKDGKPEYYTERLGQEEFVQIDTSDDVFNIFIFGGSSVVLTDSGTFTDYLSESLQKKYGKHIQLHNLGHVGYDSYDVLNRIRPTLAEASPDMIILYSGHNDFTAIYQAETHRYFMLENNPYLNWLTEIVYHHILLPHSKMTNRKIIESFDGYRDFYLEQSFIMMLQDIGWITVNPAHFRQVDQMITAHFKKNLETIVQLTNEQRVPLIVLTPISNLMAKPHGVSQSSRKPFNKAQQTVDYQQRMDLLRKAKDLDYFSGSTRAKTPLLNIIRNINGNNVHMLDLEQLMTDQKVDFGFDYFKDYVHLTGKAHQLIAEILANEISQKELCRPATEVQTEKL